MQTSVDNGLMTTIPSGPSQMELLQSQLTQVNHMMKMMIANKGMKSPEDYLHIAGTASLSSSLSHVSHHTWIIDTGATDHMFNNLKIMHDVCHLNYPLHISLPTGTTVKIT